jgi:hypothetical protein
MPTILRVRRPPKRFLDRQKLCSGTIQTSIFVCSTFSLQTVRRRRWKHGIPTRFAEVLPVEENVTGTPRKARYYFSCLNVSGNKFRLSVAKYDAEAAMERWFVTTTCWKILVHGTSCSKSFLRCGTTDSVTADYMCLAATPRQSEAPWQCVAWKHICEIPWVNNGWTMQLFSTCTASV